MCSAEQGRPVSYIPYHFASGTFPVSRTYHLRQMLYNYDRAQDRVDIKSSNQIMPSFPFSDVPVYADTVDIESKFKYARRRTVNLGYMIFTRALIRPSALAFHDFWGCMVTPDNVAQRVSTDDLRYHVWVATKRVVESRLYATHMLT